MDNVWVLFAGGFGAAILGLMGIMVQRRATPIRELLSEAERRSLDTQMLVSEGKHLCESCGRRYTVGEFCAICMQVRMLQAAPVVPRFLGPIVVVPRGADSRARSNWGYKPLYLNPAFADLFSGEEDADAQ